MTIGADGAAGRPPARVVPSRSHLVLIPSYDSGPALARTVAEARRHWAPVWVIVDGSTDGSEVAVERMAANDPQVRVLKLASNAGKGAAVLHGLAAAAHDGFTHVLTMDSDGQHPADRIADFMTRSTDVRYDGRCAMVLGKPVFDASAPSIRVKGRRVSNWWAQLETLRFDAGPAPPDGVIGDSLFGFRVYPVAPLLSIMRSTRWMRRFDFDTEAVVRLAWEGVVPINVPAAVRYPDAAEGGVSHFKYVRDNLVLAWMHLRLMAGFVVRLPRLLTRSRPM